MKKIKILAYVHMYQPLHNAGAEVMLHQMLKALVDRGHEAKVVCREIGNVTNYEGVELYDVNTANMRNLVGWSDVMVTHLDLTKRAMKIAQDSKKPLVHLVHNDSQLNFHRVSRRNAQLLVPNSEWIKNTIKMASPMVVFYPPTLPERYAVETSREAITLINMNESKGGRTFWQLARLMPERKFIGVKGAYGEQIGFERDLSNVTIYENTPDIQSIYAQTRILLMPSAYESWGRTGIEAACSGIPTIATPTPGLLESLGNSGTFVKHGDIAGYVEAIREFDNEKIYAQKSKLAKDRSIFLAKEFKKQIDELEQAFVRLV